EIDVHSRVLRREPRAELRSDGEVIVHFETVRAVPSASLFFGSLVPQDPLALPRYRRRSREHTVDRSGTRHQMRFQINDLLKPKYDIAKSRATGSGHVVYRLELHDTSASLAWVFDRSLAFRCAPIPCSGSARFYQAPDFELGPFVDRVETDRVTLSLETDVPTAALFSIRDAEGTEVQSIQSPQIQHRHEIEVTELQADRHYFYYVAIVDAQGETAVSRGASFRTAPGTDQGQSSFRFVALSDSRSGWGTTEDRYGGHNRRVLTALLTQALQHRPRFAVFVGDLVDGYTTSPDAFRFELRSWQRSTSAVGGFLPIYEIMGNHEVVLRAFSSGWAVGRTGAGAPEAIFASLFVNPENGPTAKRGEPPLKENVYSFDWGGLHLAAINSNYYYRSHFERSDHPAYGRGHREGWVDDRILEWLDTDLRLARERGATHLMVFTHEPGFPNGGHLTDGMWWNGEVPEILEQRKKLYAILGRYGVAAIVHGDEHNYSRMRVDAALLPDLDRPITQFISGGAGAPFYAQAEEVPWASHVEAFDARQHFVLFEVDGHRLYGKAVSISGEVIDSFVLAE
ncbi:MAG: metallophosphoesterase, partial [Myxococcota bacterium]